MIKKILFWIYVVAGPLLIIVLTFGESLWPLRIPIDYLYIILVGFVSFIMSVILLTRKSWDSKKRRVLYIITPMLLYLGLTPIALQFTDGRCDKVTLIMLIVIVALIYSVFSHLTVLIYVHWIKKQDRFEKPDETKLTRIIRRIKKGIQILTLTSLMLILPLLGFGLVILFNSEIRIDYMVYQYKQEPTSENLTTLTIELINYRGYEDRLIYLPIALSDETVLKNLYDRHDESFREILYSLMGESNLSYIIYPEDAKALVMTQYINAHLLLGNEEEYLDLMMNRTEQYGERYDFYYMFVANIFMYNKEYEPVLPDMLDWLEQVYDAIDAKDKTLLLQRMSNIRIRQTIYFLFGDQESDDALQVVFDQLFEELKAYKESQKNP